MAEPWTRPDDDSSGGGSRPFDRQALQATLADAVRTASDADAMDTPGNRPLRGPTPSGSAAAPADDAAPASAVLAPRPQPARSVNPFSRGSSEPDPAAPAAAQAAQPAPTPKRPASLLGGGAPASVGSSGLGSSPGLGSPSPLSAPGALSAAGLGSTSGAGSSGLRTPSPGSLGPISFGADSRVTGDLSAGRSTAALAPAPAEQPTIALRRRQPAETAPSARSTEEKPSAAPAQSAPAAPARAAVSIEGWTPGDDDILPRRVVKRSFRRR